MKTLLVLSTLFSAIAPPALGALTDTDLEKIRSIVTKEIQEELKPIKADIATLKTDMAVMKTEVANLKEPDQHGIRKNSMANLHRWLLEVTRTIGEARLW